MLIPWGIKERKHRVAMLVFSGSLSVTSRVEANASLPSREKYWNWAGNTKCSGVLLTSPRCEEPLESFMPPLDFYQTCRLMTSPRRLVRPTQRVTQSDACMYSLSHATTNSILHFNRHLRQAGLSRHRLLLQPEELGAWLTQSC